MSESSAPSALDILVARLDDRAWRLRRQAHIFLTIIILVLIAGAAAFVYANKIVALGQSRSAAAEYAAVEAAYKRLEQRAGEINTQINNIVDTASFQKPFNDEIERLKLPVYAAEDEVVKDCKSVMHKQNHENPNYSPTPQPARDRVGEYFVLFPMRDVYFGNLQDAADCGQKLARNMQSIGELIKPINIVQSDRNTRTNQFRASKETELEPYNKQLQELNEELSRLQPVLADTRKRATEERVLGAPLEADNKTSALEKPEPTDWAQIIQSNLTRLASLGIMFFLVAILVPQYRYNIRMAAFYDARADSIRLAGKLPAITHVEDLEKTILAMTPNIDFGKAPSTPIDQLVGLIKAAKG
jgi:CHASE3 domain sensor protein